MFNSLYNKLKEDKFEDLFQPKSDAEVGAARKAYLVKKDAEKRLHQAQADAKKKLEQPRKDAKQSGWEVFSKIVFKEGRCTLNPDGTYSCEGNVDISKANLTKIPVKFKDVKGSFNCSGNDLTSLEGSPETVGEIFWATHNKLTSLKGGPKEVGAFYSVAYNELTSLEGGPEKVGTIVAFSYTPIARKLRRNSIKGTQLDRLVSYTEQYNSIINKR